MKTINALSNAARHDASDDCRPKWRSAAMRILSGCLLSAALSQSSYADAIDMIGQSGVIKVGVFEDYPPFGSMDATMQPVGYDIDMAALLGKGLKAKAVLVPVTGDNRMAFLAAHKVDLLLSVGETPERDKVIDFSDPYAPYFLAVFGPKSMKVTGAADLASRSVGVSRGTLEDLTITKVAPSTAVIKRFDDSNGAISAFLAGQVDVLVTGNDVGATIMARHPAIDPVEKFPLFSSPDRVGMKKDEPGLKAAVNRIIAQAKQDGSLNAISKKWLLAPLPKGF